MHYRIARMKSSCRLDANVSLLFCEHPFLERFERAREAGFHAVEFHWHRGIDPAAIRAAVQDAGLQVALINFDGGDLAAGDRGLIADPDRCEEFRGNVPVALTLARELGCTRLNALVGKRLPTIALDRQMALARSTLAWAADAAALSRTEVLIEPLNTHDNGPCLVSTMALASALACATSRLNVRLQFDAYHVSRMGEDPADALLRHGSKVAHVQLADDPGRGEPGSGAIDFERLRRSLAEIGYAGWIGLEYVPPGGDTPASLDRLWRRGWRTLL
jgi:hydroxypyruvate isomerase